MDSKDVIQPPCDQCVFAASGIKRRLDAHTCDSVPQARVCIVMEGPTESAFQTGEFIDYRTNLLWRVVQHKCATLFGDKGYPPFAITGAVLCKLPQVADVVSCKCRTRLFDFIHRSGCTTILAVGAAAVAAITGSARFSISQIQGWPQRVRLPEISPTKEFSLIPCYNPAHLHLKPLEYNNFAYAIELAVYAAYGQIPQALHGPAPTVWTLLDTPEKLTAFYDTVLREHVKYIACDIETSGLDFQSDVLLCLGLCYAKGQAVVVPAQMLHDSPEHVNKLLTLPGVRYIWHNGKFDQNFLNTRGFDVRVDDDTLLLHYALDENTGTHGLEMLSGRLLGAPNYKQQLRSNLDEPNDSYAKLPLDILHHYQAQDVDYTLQLFHILFEKVTLDPQLLWLYTNILMPAQNFLHSVEVRGFYTFLDNLIAADAHMKNQIENVYKEVCQEAAPYWDAATYARDMRVVREPAIFNPGSPKQVAWLLYKRFKCVPTVQGAKKRAESAILPDTSVATLQSIEPKPRFVAKLLALRKLKKLHSTYVLSLLAKRDKAGRIHTTYSLYGTTTGRLASKKPNLQNIPRDKTVKSLFGAPPERLILECDYKSAELRALAMYSRDPFLIRVFCGNFDMHDETAAAMFGKNFTSEQRMQAKMINFGIMYGRGPKTIAEACNITVQEAQDSINKWLARMPAAAAYLRSRRNAIQSGCVLITPFGRKRRFPFVPSQMRNAYQNEACNFAIQSVASDFTLMTGIRIQPQLLQFDAHIVNLVHDSLVIELPKNQEIASHLFTWVPQQMSVTPSLWFDLPFKFVADASIGTHWGCLHDSVTAAFEE